LTSNADHQPNGGEKACAPIAAPEQRDLLFRPDPLRPVRLLKWGVRLVVFTLILALGPLHNFSLSDSAWDVAGFWITGSFIGMVGIEFAFYHMFRLAKRGAYPSLLATELGAVRDFNTACTTAVDSCATLLNGEAGSLFWLASEEGLASRLAQASRGWTEETIGPDHELIVEAAATNRVAMGALSLRTTRRRDGWLACIPLVSLNRTVGVLALARSRPSSDLRDGSLLAAIGVAVGAALYSLHYEMELEEMARRDELTHLFNRRYLFQALRKELDDARGLRRPLSVVVLDVDGMKLINDTYGHAVGDLVLAKLGNLLVKSVRAEDVAARVGGDEFAILMPDTDEKQARAGAARIEEALEQQVISLPQSKNLDVHVSFGVAGYPWSAKDPAQIMHCADIEMYDRKAQRKGSRPAASITSAHA